MDLLTCLSCHSKRLLRNEEIVTHAALRAFFGPYPITVQVPATSALKGGAQSRVSTQVCVDCGSIALQAVDLAELRSAYALIAEPLGLNS